MLNGFRWKRLHNQSHETATRKEALESAFTEGKLLTASAKTTDEEKHTQAASLFIHALEGNNSKPFGPLFKVGAGVREMILIVS